MEPGTTIVKLGGEGGMPKVVSFEEAFGEFSNAKGSKRNERKKRKQERKLARIAAKKERKLAKQDMRSSTMQAKQDKKSLKKSLKHQRRTDSKQARVDRRAIGQEEMAEDNGHQEPAEEQETAGESSQQGGTGSIEDYTPGQQPTNADDASAGYGEEESGEDAEEEAEEAEEGEEGGEEEESDEESEGFDGDLGADGQMSDVTPTVNPRIADLTSKIEWNKELICRMRKAKSEAETKGESTAIIEGKINGRVARVKELEKQLDMYSKLTGGVNNNEIQRQIATGRMNAKRKRLALRNKPGRHGGSETIVKSDLNPEMSEQRIEVPASNATGIIAIDGKDDFDNDDATKVELKSNASGKQSGGIKLKHVAIGVGLAIVGIIVYNKFIKKAK